MSADTTPGLEAERAAFEALPEFVADPGLLQRQLDGSSYIYTHVDGMWVGWQAARRAPAPAPPQYPPMPEHWAVVASVNGHDILCISDNALTGGGEPSDEEAQAIIGMAQHLLAFVGYGMPPCDFDPDDTAPAPQGQTLAEFVLQALVAAGHATQDKVDAAMRLPGAPAASGELVAPQKEKP